MATITLYRPIGTAELALIKGASWRAFPAMSQGHQFYAYRQPPDDPHHWRERLQDLEDIPEVGQEDVVKSWDAWGNSPTRAFIVAFELDEHSPLRLDRWDDRCYDVNEINAALVGPISLHKSISAEE